VIRIKGRPDRCDGDGVWWTDDAGQTGFVAADALVLADRRTPQRPAGLEAVSAEVSRVGDARQPRDLTAAIAEGREAVEAFTRTQAGSTTTNQVKE